jgi:hypothetical protein
MTPALKTTKVGLIISLVVHYSNYQNNQLNKNTNIDTMVIFHKILNKKNMIIFCFSHLKNINLMKQLNLGASVKMMQQGHQLNCPGRKLPAIDPEILSDCVGGIPR